MQADNAVRTFAEVRGCICFFPRVQPVKVYLARGTPPKTVKSGHGAPIRVAVKIVRREPDNAEGT